MSEKIACSTSSSSSSSVSSASLVAASVGDEVKATGDRVSVISSPSTSPPVQHKSSGKMRYGKNGMYMKPDAARTYYDDGYRRRAGCICIRPLSSKETTSVVQDGGGSADAEGKEVAGGSTTDEQSSSAASVTCFQDSFEVLLVSSTKQKDKRKWIIPAGGVDPGEERDTVSAAMRESLEEAGAVGKMVADLGTFDHEKKKTRTSMFILLVDRLVDFENGWTEGDKRERQWMSLADAEIALSPRPQYLDILKKATEQIAVLRQYASQ